MNLTITLDTTASQRQLLAAHEALRRDLGPVLEVAVMECVQSHLNAHYVGKPNKLGGASTGYWTTVRNSAAGEHKSNGDGSHEITVSLTGIGLRMKLEGGVIRPTGRTSSVTGKQIKFLTIPVNPIAHGKTVSDFGDGVERVGGGLFKKLPGRAFGEQLFLLAKQATIKADPNIWPRTETLAAKCGEAAVMLFRSVSESGK